MPIAHRDNPPLQIVFKGGAIAGTLGIAVIPAVTAAAHQTSPAVAVAAIRHRGMPVAGRTATGTVTARGPGLIAGSPSRRGITANREAIAVRIPHAAAVRMGMRETVVPIRAGITVRGSGKTLAVATMGRTEMMVPIVPVAATAMTQVVVIVVSSLRTRAAIGITTTVPTATSAAVGMAATFPTCRRSNPAICGMVPVVACNVVSSPWVDGTATTVPVWATVPTMVG